MLIEIKSWMDGSLLFSGDHPDRRTAIMAAVNGDADLRRADLSDAVLSDAKLSDAKLSGVDLRRADLRRANLRRADLRRADLSDAVLSDADLRRADLRRADLRRANLSDAVLSDAVLSDADLSGANLSGADLRRADLSDAVPSIPHIDAEILSRIESGAGRLDMSSWHTCNTTHCRAGWAIVLAGNAGVELEKSVGSCAAGAMIYAASRRTMKVPNFFARDADAISDIRACAAADPLPTVGT